MIKRFYFVFPTKLRFTILVFNYMLGRTQKLIRVLQHSEYFLSKQFKNVKK